VVGPRRGARPAADRRTGTSKIEADGTFKLAFVPKADERAGATNKDLSTATRHVDVTDEGGETRSAERSFRLGLVSVEAAISADKGFFAVEEAASLTVTRSDLNGAPRPGKGSYKLFAIAQPSKTLLPAEQPLPRPRPGQQRGLRTPGDELRPRHEPAYSPDRLIYEWADGEVRAQGELSHDEQGRAVAALGKLPAGAWRLRYETVDDFGAKFETFKDFVVAAPKTPLALARLLRRGAHLGGRSAAPRASWCTPARAAAARPRRLPVRQAVERRLLVSGRDSDRRGAAVTEKLRGGFAVQVQALRDYQEMPRGPPSWSPGTTAS
jgi:hypothetical protein